MRLHGSHERTIPLPLSHDELVPLQRRIAQAGLAADLGGQGHDLARAAGRSPRPPSGLFRRGDPVLSVDQSAVQAAFAINRREGVESAPVGRSGLARARLLHPLPQVDDAGGPDPVSPCRRSAQPARALSGHHCVMPCRVTDSTGIKFLGDGEWQARKHGVQGRRQWRKVHLAMGPATSDIRAVEFTPSRDGDSPVLPDLLGQIPKNEEIGSVTADGAYDTRRCHIAILERDAVPIIPIRKNCRLWKADCPAARVRNETLRATRNYGRAFWKRWSGYHARSRIEAKMRCLKAFGERIAAREPDRQTAEIHIRIALMNRFNAFGTAEIVRVA